MTVPGDAAIDLNKGSRVNLVGDYNVCYGDIVLKDGSCLAVYGNLTVYGDIHIYGNSTLVCTGKLYFTDDAFPRYNTLDGSNNRKSKIYYYSGASKTKNLYPSDIEENISTVDTDNFKSLLTLLNLDDNDGNNDGLMKKVLRNANFLGGSNYIVNYNLNSVTHGSNSDKTGLTKNNICADINQIVGYRTTSAFNGKNIGFGFLANNPDTINKGAHDILLLASRPSNSKLIVKNNIPNSTIISNVEVELGVQHGVVVSKIGSDEFNYITGIKGKKFTGTDAQRAASTDPEVDKNPAYKTSPFNNIELTFGAMSTAFPNGQWQTQMNNFAVGEFFNPNCNLYVDQTFGFATSGSGAESKTYAGKIYFDDYQRNAYEEP